MVLFHVSSSRRQPVIRHDIMEMGKSIYPKNQQPTTCSNLTMSCYFIFVVFLLSIFLPFLSSSLFTCQQANDRGLIPSVAVYFLFGIPFPFFSFFNSYFSTLIWVPDVHLMVPFARSFLSFYNFTYPDIFSASFNLPYVSFSKWLYPVKHGVISG